MQDFALANGTINSQGEATIINVNGNTDFTQASLTLATGTVVNVAADTSVAFTDTQLVALYTGGSSLHALASSSNLVIDVTAASFAPGVPVPAWTGSMTLDSNSASGQTIDASGLNGNSFEGTGHGVYIYGGTGGDMIIGTNNATGADYLNGGGGDDIIFFKGGDAIGDTVDGGTGNNTIEIAGGATNDFHRNGDSAITNIQTVQLDAGGSMTTVTVILRSDPGRSGLDRRSPERDQLRRRSRLPVRGHR